MCLAINHKPYASEGIALDISSIRSSPVWDVPQERIKKEASKAIYQDQVPMEIWHLILPHCSDDTLYSFSQANHWTLWLVSEFYDAKIQGLQSILRSLPLKADFKNLLDAFDPECKEKTILEKRKQKRDFVQNSYYHSILDGIPSAWGTPFDKETKVLFDKEFLRKNHIELIEVKKLISYQHIAAEQLIRTVIFSKTLLKRGNAREAVRLLISLRGFISTWSITVGSLQKIGFWDSGKMPSIVWSDQNTKIENVTRCTRISWDHAVFILKYFFTLCTQDHMPNWEIFLRISPKYILFGLGTTDLEEDARDDIVKSGVFCSNNMYDQLFNFYTHPFHKDNYDPPFFTLLLEHGFDINYTNRDGQSPLQLALLRNNWDMACFFMRHGATINWNPAYVDKLLWLAVAIRDVETVEEAVRQGANVNSQSTLFNLVQGGSLLAWAKHINTPQSIIKVLEDNRAHINLLEINWVRVFYNWCVKFTAASLVYGGLTLLSSIALLGLLIVLTISCMVFGLTLGVLGPFILDIFLFLFCISSIEILVALAVNFVLQPIFLGLMYIPYMAYHKMRPITQD